ncbi:hypothetical protein C8F04DRAFT_1190986 [Mycena alexandri]|uniref:Uncharacterized protein n=1 Tax=Mycena alexandri TaxID=1745969 RepID=A0AAD6SE33_9AGAR|nr:hypothetical protein C8F04DRAFT_1190986 [Mycena alexandri]
MLISEDRDISIEDATMVLEESSDLGDLLQCYDEEDLTIDQLHHKNIHQIKRSKNYFFTTQDKPQLHGNAPPKKPAGKPQALTLDDFKEPPSLAQSKSKAKLYVLHLIALKGGGGGGGRGQGRDWV